uniref:Apolipoprotein L3-like n=1 Tax=Sus scrofa TaxID=9823 RepID=A0A8D1V8X5_PIG
MVPAQHLVPAQPSVHRGSLFRNQTENRTGFLFTGFLVASTLPFLQDSSTWREDLLSSGNKPGSIWAQRVCLVIAEPHSWGPDPHGERSCFVLTLSPRKTPGEEADALCEYLEELETDLSMKNKEKLDRKRFLTRFPHIKLELEERIGKLHALADKADKVHRDCTISKVVATSADAVSSVLTIVGLSLAPVTAGVSLALSTTGLGLRIAALVTSVSTDIVDKISLSLRETEASCLLSTDIKKWQVVVQVLVKNTPKIVDNARVLAKAIERVETNIRAMERVKVNPCLEAHSNLLWTDEGIEALSSTQRKAAFRGSALAMTKNARIMGIATAGVGLLVDVGFLVKESIHLHKGAKTQLAEALRQRAQKLEGKLEELTCIYDSLQEGPTPPPPEQCTDQTHVQGQD